MAESRDRGGEPVVLGLADGVELVVVAQVARGWRLALGREPDAEELRLAESLAAEHGLEAVCRGLFNLAEFVVID